MIIIQTVSTKVYQKVKYLVVLNIGNTDEISYVWFCLNNERGKDYIFMIRTHEWDKDKFDCLESDSLSVLNQISEFYYRTLFIWRRVV